MPRSTYARTPKGRLYCVEWPEWHVECAADGCAEDGLVSALGECTTKREAEQRAATGTAENMAGWVRAGGVWYCPAHTPKQE